MLNGWRNMNTKSRTGVRTRQLVRPVYSFMDVLFVNMLTVENTTFYHEGPEMGNVLFCFSQDQHPVRCCHISHNPLIPFELWLDPHGDLRGRSKCPWLLLLLQDWSRSSVITPKSPCENGSLGLSSESCFTLRKIRKIRILNIVNHGLSLFPLLILKPFSLLPRFRLQLFTKMTAAILLKSSVSESRESLVSSRLCVLLLLTSSLNFVCAAGNKYCVAAILGYFSGGIF